MWYLLIAVGFAFLFIAITDLLFDITYWCYALYKKLKMRRFKPLSYDVLLSKPEKAIAIMIPCWDESSVIGDMIRYNNANIVYGNYDYFIGAYPNDEKTLAVVRQLEKKYHNVHLAINNDDGPNTKAENLNHMFYYILEHEQSYNKHYEVFVMHDSEDVIHPLSLKLYNHLIPAKDYIQVPVFPLEISQRQFIHWTYNDEFSQLHTRELVAREILGGFIPSAGVGTAFARGTLEKIRREDGRPFETKTFTEDYGSTLRMDRLGIKGIFLWQKIQRVFPKKRWWLFGATVPKKSHDFIATRSLFQSDYGKAIKQKSRWILGIAFQEWAETGWPGTWKTKALLFHDRKSIISYIVGGLGYIVFGYWFVIYLWSLYDSETLNLSYFIERHPWVMILLLACFFTMVERVIQQCIATWRVYGLLPMLLVPPRMLLANIINLHAQIRAYSRFWLGMKDKTKARWGATENRFPSEQQLSKYRRRLGDLLIDHEVINAGQLEQVLQEQQKTGKHIGELLVSHEYLSNEVLARTLAEEYHLPYQKVSLNEILPLEKVPEMTQQQIMYLASLECYVIKYFSDNVVLACTNPSDVLDNPKVEAIFPNKIINHVVTPTITKT